MKFLYGFFNRQTGESIVTLSNQGELFIGRAQLHPDDKNSANELTGCRLAEHRAWIKIFQNERKKKKIMLKAIQNLNQDIKQNCSSIDPSIQRRINLKLRDYTNEVQELSNQIDFLTKSLFKSIKARDELLKRSKQDNTIK